ncbi:hypothetical protein BRC72_09545 [Halobacteriales archaeon QH_7_66_36]|nr:MAG: hypothetical protein BRC72_09545 [Halobacteriales archaeon QH_7_66_36]
MGPSEFAYQYSTDKRRGVQYNIGVRADPSLNDVESFATILFFQLGDGTRVQVAKVDDSPHEGEQDIHVDRYYRAPDAEVKDFDVDIEDPFEAERYLKQNWKQFVDRYYESHGLEPREDGVNI